MPLIVNITKFEDFQRLAPFGSRVFICEMKRTTPLMPGAAIGTADYRIVLSTVSDYQHGVAYVYRFWVGRATEVNGRIEQDDASRAASERFGAAAKLIRDKLDGNYELYDRAVHVGGEKASNALIDGEPPEFLKIDWKGSKVELAEPAIGGGEFKEKDIPF